MKKLNSEVDNINNLTSSITSTISNMPNTGKSSSFNAGNGGMNNQQPKQFNIQNIHVIKPNSVGDGPYSGGMGMSNQNTQRSNDGGMNLQSQSRMNPSASSGFLENNYSSSMPSNMASPNK